MLVKTPIRPRKLPYPRRTQLPTNLRRPPRDGRKTLPARETCVSNRNCFTAKRHTSLCRSSPYAIQNQDFCYSFSMKRKTIPREAGMNSARKIDCTWHSTSLGVPKKNHFGQLLEMPTGKLLPRPTFSFPNFNQCLRHDIWIISDQFSMNEYFTVWLLLNTFFILWYAFRIILFI